ncbi:MAG: methionine adenosyltransferase [Proteobacteria bacterium]|nr:methionine adenosyltransferase [Pseudomonadota bacterium]
MLDDQENLEVFSSESVSEGHPDKIADQISDSILDEIIRIDPYARVACEVLVNSQFVVISGEISANAHIDYEQVARRIITNIGYNDDELGLNGHTCQVIVGINEQSQDIAGGVMQGDSWQGDLGAGDQGLMFGYACNETPVFMPAPIYYAHLLMKELSRQRKTGVVSWLRPDAKSQVTVSYQNNQISSIPCVVLSTQHNAEVSHHDLKEFVIEEVIKQIIPQKYLKNTEYLINPTGQFIKGGPASDTGLTGRKIIVDTYGGRGAHGGGAFSGKDPTKVDRSAAYMARYIAKNIVASGAAERCLIQVAYAIGVDKPVSIWLNHYGTNHIPTLELKKHIMNHFSLIPKDIIHSLQLRKPIYLETATFGHFGRPHFRWEKTDKVNVFK